MCRYSLNEILHQIFKKYGDTIVTMKIFQQNTYFPRLLVLGRFITEKIIETVCQKNIDKWLATSNLKHKVNK